MTRSDTYTTELFRLFEKQIKLDQTITQHVRIWRESLFISFIDILDDILVILRTKIEDDERLYPEASRDFHGHISIFSGMTAWVRFISIVFHKASYDVIPLFDEQRSTHGGVYTTGESYKDFFLGRLHFFNAG